jgi:hypothetical protein
MSAVVIEFPPLLYAQLSFADRFRIQGNPHVEGADWSHWTVQRDGSRSISFRGGGIEVRPLRIKGRRRVWLWEWRLTFANGYWRTGNEQSPERARDTAIYNDYVVRRCMTGPKTPTPPRPTEAA